MAGKHRGSGTSHAAKDIELSRLAGFNIYVQDISGDSRGSYITKMGGEGAPPVFVNKSDSIAIGCIYTDNRSLEEGGGVSYVSQHNGTDVLWGISDAPVDRPVNITITMVSGVSTYALGFPVVEPQNSSVSYDGQSLVYPNDYSLVGSGITLTLPYAIETGDTIDVHFRTSV